MTNEIIGRKKEIAELQDIFNSKEAEFVAIYGRRRVGKTYLVKNFFRQKKCKLFYAIGIRDSDLRQQLTKFTDELADTFFPGLKLKTPKSWMEAFSLLTNAINEYTKSEKIIIFLDELPWMATPRSKLLQALSYYWNRHWSDNPKIKLIICGSSSSWIIRKIIKSKGGLHNRVTRRMLLLPYDLSTTREYLKYLNIRLSDKQILEAYMVFGGIPFYLRQLKKGKSITQSIDALCFAKNGSLFDEFDNLFSSLFDDDADAHIEIIRKIAKHPNGLARKDILTSFKKMKKGGTLTRRLKQLEQTGFILGFLPIDKKKKGLYYKVIDEYTLYYLTWIDPIANTLIQEEVEPYYWKGMYKTPQWYTWAGQAFEAICYKHTNQIRRYFQIPQGSVIGSWRFTPPTKSKQPGTQIDLLFDRRDDTVTLCEIKFNEKPFIIDKTYARNLMNKIDVYITQTKTKKQIFMVMITVNGIKDTLYSDDLITSTMTIDDFFV